MQYQDFLSEVDRPERYDCARRAKDHPKCLSVQAEFEIQVTDFAGGIGKHKRIIKNAEDIWKYLEYARDLVPEYNEIQHLLIVSGTDICPAPLFSRLSLELWNMVVFCGENRFPYPGGYFDQLAIFIDAARIINSERARLLRKRMKDQDGQKRS